MLNIVGGLDSYDSGDLIINGVSTKNYKDRDWDTYRNDTIGFVFQSYNLIPHQTVLGNVEIALTISGVSKSERKKRAKEALEKVGLSAHIKKKPNQLSGGQMQRVAIARALVNNPSILLADEPTGALDTETSVQIMELLKEVAEEKLVIMVTHNPELAEQYSSRIVKLRDGKILDDSDAYEPTEDEKSAITKAAAEKKKTKMAKMSWLTSTALSLKNLMTKKRRTFLTAFAGSIGIIGIALILSMSTGVNKYVEDLQKNTMSSYPLTITAEAFNMSMNPADLAKFADSMPKNTEDKVYSDSTMLRIGNIMMTENNLTDFKKYLDDPNSEIAAYLGENGVTYSYITDFSVYSYDENGKLVNTDADPSDLVEKDQNDMMSLMMGNMENGMTMMTQMGGGTVSASASNFAELTAGPNNLIAESVTKNYDIIAGAWPANYDEVVLFLGRNNTLQIDQLYQLGLVTDKEYKEIAEKIENEEDVAEIIYDFDEILNHELYMLTASDKYTENEDGTFKKHDDSYYSSNKDEITSKTKLKISGIAIMNEDSENAMLTAPIGYTSKLTEYVINLTNDSKVIKAQEADENINVLTGMSFKALSDEKKSEDAINYLTSMNVADKSNFITYMMYTGAISMEDLAAASAPASMNIEAIMATMSPEEQSAFAAMSPEEQQAAMMSYTQPAPSAADMSGMGMAMDEESMAAMLDMWLDSSPEEEVLVGIYDETIGNSSYSKNLKEFGKVSYDAPSAINIYTDTFEAKDGVSLSIENYNASATEDNKITYTDYVAMLTSSMTTIIDVISYVLIAFVSVSLIVSCIMIGIITHISVMERTKEIGVLRALGASKRNISQVFNAETMLIGFFSGLIGVGVTALLNIPLTAIVCMLVDDDTLAAVLPFPSAVILVVISVIITLIGGLIPAKAAAKKDPVIALRTE